MSKSVVIVLGEVQGKAQCSQNRAKQVIIQFCRNGPDESRSPRCSYLKRKFSDSDNSNDNDNNNTDDNNDNKNDDTCKKDL